jgi:hypothetical protein
MKRLAGSVAGLGLVLLMSGCGQAFLNEGSSQVRGVPADGQVSFRQTYFAPSDPASPGVVKAGTPDQPGDAVSVTLLSAFICDFHEAKGLVAAIFSNNDTSNADAIPCLDGRKPGANGGTAGGDRQTRGEIAVLANIGERSDTVGLTINPADLGKKARVIYYNDDVRESGQLLNAMNIPIYGPKLYGGKPFILEVTVLELDNDENAQIKGLLSTLAGIGDKAYPPASPILGVLDALGGSLLSGNQDDRELAYQMQFDVQGPASSAVHRLYLQEGYYALLRNENRGGDIPWDDIKLDREKGLLVWAAGDKAGQVYRERTWLLLRVAREQLAATVQQETGQLLSEFLSSKGTFEAKDFDALSVEYQKLLQVLK